MRDTITRNVGTLLVRPRVTRLWRLMTLLPPLGFSLWAMQTLLASYLTWQLLLRPRPDKRRPAMVLPLLVIRPTGL